MSGHAWPAHPAPQLVVVWGESVHSWDIPIGRDKRTRDIGIKRSRRLVWNLKRFHDAVVGFVDRIHPL
ncbi:hypothetical protein Q8A67_005874 [Cirrhinus molitorella]|uniref:Uncharacterized protein n=1 Tax=Cirrhinus molitorella TaxID=172907 RepID=A0AA88Q7X9_9TELE|nr:hypothetical protein Q8A67_005874 [Cirrhinus molitorella]